MKGVYTALITPFSSSGKIDLGLWEQLIQRQIDAGVSGIVVAGSTGEGQCLEKEEWSALIERAGKLGAGKIDVMASCGSFSTAETIRKVKEAESLGASSFLVSTPPYIKPTQEGLVRHFEGISLETTRPIMVYNIPGRTAVGLTAESIQRLWEFDSVQAIKESSGDWGLFLKIQQSLPTDKFLFSGDDPAALAMAAHGASGIVSVVANLFPIAWVDFWRSAEEGKYEAAREIFSQLIELIHHLFCESNPIPTKWAMGEILGQKLPPRMPLLELSEKNRPILSEKLKAAQKFFPE